MSRRRIKVKYIYHSGFQVETNKHIFVFDYYLGSVDLNNSHKKVYIFSSHSHPDHFNPQILDWKTKYHDITYILSSDITVNQHGDNVYFLSPYEEIQVDNIRIKAYGSTDLGVSFLVLSDNFTLFHAGDLNWWYWWQDTPEGIQKAEKWFKEEISRIKGEAIDIAFFPVDPRLEHLYCVGADYFIQEVAPLYLIPMHFANDFEAPKRYAEKTNWPQTHVIPITKKEQEIILDLPGKNE